MLLVLQTARQLYQGELIPEKNTSFIKMLLSLG